MSRVEAEQEQLTFLRQVHPSLELVYQLVQEFTTMVRTLQGERLETWLADVRASHISELLREVSGVERDKAAVQAALLLSYSNGVVEGHVHRLKLIKRMGYGRARFPLLRKPSPLPSLVKLNGRSQSPSTFPPSCHWQDAQTTSPLRPVESLAEFFGSCHAAPPDPPHSQCARW